MPQTGPERACRCTLVAACDKACCSGCAWAPAASSPSNGVPVAYNEKTMRAQFKNRKQAAALLARRLQIYAGRSDVVVLGLPRGGVPPAAVIARALHAPLDVLLVCKLGLPGDPEFGIGAVGSDGSCVLHTDVIGALRIPPVVVEAIARAAQAMLAERAVRYRRGAPAVPLHGKVAIVVDDGVATGATMEAALRLLRRQHPAQVIVAIPVAPPEVVRTLKQQADGVVCLQAPPDFLAVGSYYRDFGQVSDEAVMRLLQQNAAASAGPGQAMME